ncbi:MAG: polymer-forming cytoskeletal protein [Candidatus Promineofilum sp.]|nr:polymer-forming cytoskeletal protein [Promineifilum sp.]MCW5862263.1 polymer-forming cytoskeletal protein [Anaerolineae bacterium]
MRGKVIFLILGLLVVAGLVAPSVHAADIRRGERVVIAADEVIDDDLVVSAQYIEINGTVTGDLVATGTIIVVNGTVEGSALLAAQSLEVRGRVEGSIYGAAYSLLLDEGAAIHRNVLFGGFSAITRPDSEIDRDLYVAGYQLLHDGMVHGDVNVATSALEINGSVGGDVRGEVSAAGGGMPRQFALPNMPANVTMLPTGLVIGQTAQIAGQVAVQEITPAAQPTRGAFGLPLWLSNRIGQAIGLLLVAILLIALAPRLLPGLGDALRAEPLPALGWGLLIYVLLFPLALFVGVVLVVLITILFGVVTFGQYTAAVLGLTASAYVFGLFAFLFFTYIIAWLVVGHLVGRLLLGRGKTGRPSRWAQFAYVLLGVLLFQALRAVPVLSFVLAFFVGSLALGAVFIDWRSRRRAPKVIAQPGV